MANLIKDTKTLAAKVVAGVFSTNKKSKLTIKNSVNPIKNGIKIFEGFSAFGVFFSDFFHKVVEDLDGVMNGRISQSGINNFRIGLYMLKSGKLTDAKFRFFLASMFHLNSPTLFFHLAYVNYLQGNIKTSCKYLRESLKLSNNIHSRSLALIMRIAKTHPDLLQNARAKKIFPAKDSNP